MLREKMNLIGISIFAFMVLLQTAHTINRQCSSPIYCEGKLLKTIQMANIFPDSKTFVDMEMKHSPSDVLKNFKNLMDNTEELPTRHQVNDFINDNFQPGEELEAWSPPDYNPNPPILKTIKNTKYRDFAKELIPIWSNLSRIINPKVNDHPERYSIINVPNGFVVPGGRFKEFYYWDTYWIIKGLLASGMVETARGMIENFFSMVKQFGFVPNGGRVYYLNRSQPPLLTLMVYDYIKATNNYKWLENYVNLLDKELKYWLKSQTVTFDYKNAKHILARYAVDSASPRPESYREDVKTCSSRLTKEAKENCYKDLKSAAETGWDFSSRWLFDTNGNYSSNLSSIQTSRVIPVDLNSFLARAFYILSGFYGKLGNQERGNIWMKLHLRWKKSINTVLYDENDGVWYDFDLVKKQTRKGFFPSNLAPLWCQIFEEDYSGDRAVAYLKTNGVLSYPGGIPTSMFKTGEQWDLPNAWPPLQSIVILGLKRTQSKLALDTAKQLTRVWIDNNLQIFQKTGVMFEKYDAVRVGSSGGGGEYSIQSGFGWTNGVIFELLSEFYT